MTVYLSDWCIRLPVLLPCRHCYWFVIVFMYLLSRMNLYFFTENKIFDFAVASGQLGGSGETAAASAADAG